MSKKMGVGLQNLLPRFTCTDATTDVLWSYDCEKRFVEVVKEVTFGRSQSYIAGRGVARRGGGGGGGSRGSRPPHF